MVQNPLSVNEKPLWPNKMSLQVWKDEEKINKLGVKWPLFLPNFVLNHGRVRYTKA